MNRLILWLSVVVSWGVVCDGQANTASPVLRVAVAANFAAPLKKVLPEFEAANGIETQVIVGSSGALFAQIQHGAPYDLFLSADSLRPQTLVSAGRISESQVFTYAIGRLALVGNISGLEDPVLLQSGTRVAIAEPDIAPYGQAARELLQQAGLWEPLSAALIRGSNIQQTLQFWQTGNVDVAFIAASQCITYALKCQTLPPAYAPIEQQLAITSVSEQADVAARLADYLRSPKVQQQLTELGYVPLFQTPSEGKQ